MKEKQSKSFNFTEAMERLIRHISKVCPEFSHLDSERIIVATLQTRSPGLHGVYASVQPLRFKDGERMIKRRGRTYIMPEVRHDGKEILYIIYFALPRFLNLWFEEKLTTIFHELYHISPQFNGDLRRFPGRNYAHGHSRKKYNELLQPLIAEYISNAEAKEMTEFLRQNFQELEERYGKVVGTKIKPPRPSLA
ncbi:MAG: putative metallopeptidase [Armatimonadota bacterium]|nr:putative metallopeptidase [Armatimonadota bacterium]